MAYVEYTTISIGEHEVFVESLDATQSFKLHPLDIEFIEQDILETNSTSGELEVIVEEGLINIEWQIVKSSKL